MGRGGLRRTQVTGITASGDIRYVSSVSLPISRAGLYDLSSISTSPVLAWLLRASVIVHPPLQSRTRLGHSKSFLLNHLRYLRSLDLLPHSVTDTLILVQFAIGECGMPMEEARCPECGAPVGGSNHQAVAGVTRATDMES